MGSPTFLQPAFTDLGGGQNDGQLANLIEDNQVAAIRNFYTFGKEIITRNGITKVTITPYTEGLVSLFGGKMDNIWQLFIGTKTGLARKSGVGLVRIPPSDTPGYVSSTEPWRMRLYKNVLYTVRRSTGQLKRSKSDFMSDAGITPPILGPTLAAGAAGALLAGAYYGVVTGYNRDTAAESNPSPPSAVLNLGANLKIDWSNVATFNSGQVTARRLYRTLLNQQAEYYFVDQINDNFTTTYTGDNFLTSGLGRQVSFRNGLPPSNCAFIEIWKERCILADDTTIFFSEAFMPESFYAASAIDIYPDDGHTITGLLAFGDRMIIAKTNAIHYLVGTDGSDFQLLTLSDRHGCIAPDSLKSAEGYLFWFEGTNFYRSDGSAVTSISDLKIRNLIDRIPDAQKSKISAAIYPTLAQYRVSIPVDSDVNPTLTAVYNYRNGSWQVFDGPYGAPNAMGDFYDSNEAQLIYGVFDDNNCVYDLDLGNTDDGIAIVSSFDSKAYSLSSDGFLKGLERVQLLTDTVQANINLSLIRNMESAPYKTRNGLSLATGGPWKRFNLSSMGDLAKTLQIRLTYSGVPRIRIGGLILEAMAFPSLSQPQ